MPDTAGAWEGAEMAEEEGFPTLRAGGYTGMLPGNRVTVGRDELSQVDADVDVGQFVVIQGLEDSGGVLSLVHADESEAAHSGRGEMGARVFQVEAGELTLEVLGAPESDVEP